MEKRPTTRWRITRRYARRRSAFVFLSVLLLLIGFVLITLALATIALANDQPQASQESAQESLERGGSLGIWGTVVSYAGLVLLVLATRRPALADEETLDVTSSIRIEHAGNLFFIIVLVASCLVSLMAMILIGTVGVPVGPMTLVFLLILRRAYVMDKRREVVRRKSME